MRRFVALFVLFAATSALASQPGQPLACEDFVVLVSGLTVRTYLPPVQLSAGAPQSDAPDGNRQDLLENYYPYPGMVYRTPCPSGPQDTSSSIRRFDSTGQLVEIARIEDRCTGSGKDEAALSGMAIDNQAGRLLFRLVAASLPAHDYDTLFSWCAIEGLPSYHEIFESYARDTPAWAVTTPLMPEGMRAADRFDTYWGNVTQPLDLANAHPLQCSYPPAPPSVGDYLQITAPIPTPAPGSANYVLTSVTYQGQTRAGRKASGGRLSGRDASRLPACVVE